MTQAGIFFSSNALPEPENHYVCWLDVMGTRSVLKFQSIKIAANYIMKLQIAALDARTQLGVQDIRLFPMIDGVYVCTPSRRSIVRFLNRTFYALVGHQLQPHQAGAGFMFIIRAGLAYGPVIFGDQAVGDSAVLSANPETCQRLLFGAALAQAFEAEHLAPPFGVALHESARSFAPSGIRPFSGPNWPWWRAEEGEPDRETQAAQLKPVVAGELRRRALLSLSSGYPATELDRHLAMINDYLPGATV